MLNTSSTLLSGPIVERYGSLSEPPMPLDAAKAPAKKPKDSTSGPGPRKAAPALPCCVTSPPVPKKKKAKAHLEGWSSPPVQ